MTRKRKHYTPGADPKPALAEALENLKKRKGPATEADSTPFRRILEIKPVPVLPGQLDIYGNDKGRAMTVRGEPCSTEKVNTAALRAANTIHDLAGDFAYRESYRPLEETRAPRASRDRQGRPRCAQGRRRASHRRGRQAVTPPAAELLRNPDALLTRTHLRELGYERRAVDAIFKACPNVILPGYSRPMIAVADYLALLEQSTYRGDRVHPPRFPR